MGRGPSIEARKNATDAARGKLFTKFIREITVAARTGGVDPATPIPRLRIAMDKALSREHDQGHRSSARAKRAVRRGQCRRLRGKSAAGKVTAPAAARSWSTA